MVLLRDPDDRMEGIAAILRDVTKRFEALRNQGIKLLWSREVPLPRPRLTSGLPISGGHCYATPANASIRRPCPAPTWCRSRCRSSADLYGAGSLRSPSGRSATTLASKPSGNGRTRRHPVPRHAC